MIIEANGMRNLKIFSATVVALRGTPGEILHSEREFVVAAGKGALSLGEVQLGGKATDDCDRISAWPPYVVILSEAKDCVKARALRNVPCDRSAYMRSPAIFAARDNRCVYAFQDRYLLLIIVSH